MLQPIQMKGGDVPFTIHPDHHRFRRKELGIVSIHLGTTLFPTCTFYEIIEPNTTNIIFNFFTNSSTFYCFPREALTECLTNSAPYKVVFSFLSQPSDQHVMLSNVSQELFQAIKNLVYPYETMCQNISALCKQHEEQVTHHRSEIAMLPETLYSNQSEKAHHDDSSTSISSCDDLYEKEKKKVKQDHRTGTKKCLYCGSKSTPMWRRGPQGAGTLCNACGVKWKHGKILNGNDTKPEKKRKRSNSKRKEDSSTSDSPMESSPNTSPSDLQKTSYHMTYLMDYNGNDVLEDAVEAAALLTLLKRS